MKILRPALTLAIMLMMMIAVTPLFGWIFYMPALALCRLHEKIFGNNDLG